MNSTTFIWGLYLCFLAILPCSDQAIESQESEHACIAVQKHDHDHTGEAHPDMCSPLCSCSCCQVHVVMPVVYIPISYHTFPLPQEDYHQTLISFKDFRFWRPPIV
ncbi:DUF6660 family protein [Rapidithrix thailandica]|uniref:DUF6660 family protein n=1 Tax=Rapidithrix thailandica TaxID=413964 RepID=A0AAW9SCZ0_9BACT